MLKQKFLVDFGSKLLIYFLTALIGIIVSRVVGPTVIGTVSFGYSYVSMFYFLFGLFGTSHIKLINEGKDFYDCIKVYSIIILVTLLIFLLAVFVFSYVQLHFFDNEFTDEEKIVILISVITVAFQGLLKVPDITFTALVQQVKINLPNLVSTIVHNLGRIISILLGYKAIALATSKMISIILVIPIYLFLIEKKFFSGKWNKEIFKGYLKIGLPLFLITLSISLMSNYARVFLKTSSSVDELGYFTAAIALASMLIMIGDTAGSLFFPLFSKAFQDKQYKTIRSQISKFERFLIIFVFPFILVLSINSNTIIPFLLSDKYLPSVSIFSILLFYAFLKIWSIPYYNLLNGINKFNMNAILHVIYLVIFFSLLYFLLNADLLNMGGLGLAIGMLVLEIIKLISSYLISNSVLSFDRDKRNLKYLLFFILFAILNYVIYINIIDDQNYFVKISFLIVNFLLIYSSMYIVKVIENKDLRDLNDLLNLKSLRDYIKGEIKNKRD